ncbi:Fe-S-containing hydro-lyase [Ammoniphilus sp. 3BR4]|uniref:Fe-S-containing hydro-lyase n=1 Tax=Ammoniphilus sp. 3BR4 TaxID=3158265 RepID=UPI0034654B3C
MAIYHLKTPLSEENIAQLQIGDQVFLSGTIYMARDAAHKRMIDLLEKNQQLPVDLRSQVIYYAGPGPAKPGQVIGVNAPTTAFRMDPYTPAMFEYGVKGTIGKGNRTNIVREACQKYGAISFTAIGGISATLYKCIKHAEVVAYEDLGPEAIRRLEVEDFPLLVTNDAHGQDLYEQEIAKYENMLAGSAEGLS